MNVQVHHVIVHTPEQVREILREALLIAVELKADDEQMEMVFGKAVDLLGARHSIVLTPQAAPITLEQLGLNGRRP